MKKKLLILVTAILVCFAVVGCAKKEEESNNTGNSKSPSISTYDYKEGILHKIVDEDGNVIQKDFIIEGIGLLGNRHDGEEVKFSIDSINSSFYLNEYIQVYLKTDYKEANENIKIYVIPHKTVEEIEKMSNTKLEELASEKGTIIEYNTPDKENNNYVGEGYVNMDNPIGKYDLLFLYKNKLTYYINLDLEKEEP